ncbi:MAG TPA: response regulator [Vicinamibacterales bacterium]
MQPHASSSLTSVPEVLVVDADAVTARYVPPLREHYRVSVASTSAAAVQHLERTSPALVIVELDLGDGPGEDVCRHAKASPSPSMVLVTTQRAERVPDALAAGCDGVLLKPFAPNLLYARVGRMLRAQSMSLRLRAHRQFAKSAHLRERAALFAPGTNHVWPSTHCPYCQRSGVTSFDHASHRRDWYACLSCRKVWLAKRQE